MKKVMIVEDQRVISLDLTILAKSSGFEVVNAYSGKDACDLFEVEKPDMILMDVNLETTNAGIDAAKKILAKISVPILFITAYSDTNTLSKIDDLHTGGYILKPFAKNQVLKKLNILND
jgi:DNA-binding response OmpR family regulator